MNELIDAQAAADSVYSQLGESAPPPMAGETPLAYRVRLSRGLQRFSTAYKDANLGAVARADSTTFATIEKQVRADAIAFTCTPLSVPDGQLREIVSISPGGHRVSTFQGDPFAWMGRHIQYPKRVRISRPDEFAR